MKYKIFEIATENNTYNGTRTYYCTFKNEIGFTLTMCLPSHLKDELKMSITHDELIHLKQKENEPIKNTCV